MWNVREELEKDLNAIMRDLSEELKERLMSENCEHYKVRQHPGQGGSSGGGKAAPLREPTKESPGGGGGQGQSSKDVKTYPGQGGKR